MQMAQGSKAPKEAKASEPEREGNRYTRAARVLAKDDKIDVKTLADRAFMSESTAARCLEAWQACVGALRDAGRLIAAAAVAGALALASTSAMACDAGYSISSVLSDGEVIVLDDGSVWHTDDAATAGTWAAGSDIAVCSDKLINLDDEEEVDVDRLR
jgi:hypothetical protein